jgi:hypothetical protein
MGLSVMLDGHTDVLAPYTLDSDFRSFQVVVSSAGDFPLTFQKGFKIKAGHRSLVALSAIKVDGDASLRSLASSGVNTNFLRASFIPKVKKRLTA